MIASKEFEDMLYSETEIWVLVNHLNSFAWRCEKPELDIDWFGQIEGVGDNKGYAKNGRTQTSQTWHLSKQNEHMDEFINFVLRTDKPSANNKLMIGSVSGREQGAKMMMAAQLSETNMAMDCHDYDLYSIMGIASCKSNYEELFVKMSFIHLQVLCRQVNLRVLEKLAARHQCIIYKVRCYRSIHVTHARTSTDGMAIAKHNVQWCRL